MKKSIYLILFIFISINIMGCDSKNDTMSTGSIENNDAEIKKESETMQINESKDGVIVGELLDCAEFLGQTASEIGIPKSVIKDDIVFHKTYLDGTFLGKKDYAILYFDENSEKTDRLWIHIGESTFSECENILKERFGQETGSGEEPYAEVNGGAVLWRTYETDKLQIRLSTASQRTYAEISITQKQ